ncbi:MAG: prepilin-type N-terminal cleavage/methylation domain-containing protein [Planctomycetota bacterium]|nr:prepilin-type N-terminal cleavage/methylation domain-containing protein [Planctomycetota bacterium]
MNTLRETKAARAGFTIVEVMITLMIMSMVLVVLAQVLTGARRTRDIIFNVQESQLAGPAILDMIEDDLRGIFVMNRKVLDILHVDDRASSGMDSDRLDFVTASNSRLLTPNDQRTRFIRADVTEVGYALRPNPDYPGEFLEIYRRESFGVDAEPFSSGSYTFLHDRVRRFDIQVFNEDGVDAEPLDSWGIEQGDSEHRGLPRRMEIELELEMSPRLINEYNTTKSAAMKRRVLYRRIIRFPASQHLAMNIRPVMRIPVITPPQNASGTGGSGSAGGGIQGPGGPTSQGGDFPGGAGGGPKPDIGQSGGIGFPGGDGGGGAPPIFGGG